MRNENGYAEVVTCDGPLAIKEGWQQQVHSMLAQSITKGIHGLACSGNDKSIVLINCKNVS
jgi:hypothetical protein